MGRIVGIWAGMLLVAIAVATGLGMRMGLASHAGPDGYSKLWHGATAQPPHVTQALPSVIASPSASASPSDLPSASPISTPPTPVPTGGAQSAEQQIAQAVFAAINRDRATAGLHPLAWDPRLERSARQHDLAMAHDNQLDHQLPGEPGFADRISTQGVKWTGLAENIGVTSARSTDGALGLHQSMMNEKPPDDGHRQNILSPGGTHVGVDVVLDTVHHRLWLTEDFATE